MVLGKAVNITDLALHLPEADVVVSATSCPLPFISRSLVQSALSTRNNAKMFFLDLAVPRDIEAEVSEIPGVTLCNIDDLSAFITHGLAERQAAAKNAELMIEQAILDYERINRARQTKHIICNYRQRMQQLANVELTHAINQINIGKDPATVLSEFSEKLINKLTHKPSIGLRQAAWDDQSALLELADYLFSIEDVQPV
jgi:glutamyl-tRNA reductase